MERIVEPVVDNDGPLHVERHKIDLETAIECNKETVLELQELIVVSPKPHNVIVETYISPKSDTEGVRLPPQRVDNSDINSIFLKGAEIL